MRTIPQICAEFHVHPLTVHRWIKAGKLKAFKAHIVTKRKHKKVWCVEDCQFEAIPKLIEKNQQVKYLAMVEGYKRLNQKERSNE